MTDEVQMDTSITVAIECPVCGHVERERPWRCQECGHELEDSKGTQGREKRDTSL